MKTIKLLFVLFVVALSTGCATTQKSIQFSANLDNVSSIGIITAEARPAETSYTGAIGLLDYGIISAMNSELDKHLKGLRFEAYQGFGLELKEVLAGKGYNAVVIDEVMNIEAADKLKDPADGKNKNDFSHYQNKYGVDHLLIVKMGLIGTTRSYYGPMPTSEPMGNANLTAQLIDLNTNELKWYRSAGIQRLITPPWDEAGNGYPNLTEAVFTSLNDTLRLLKQDLKSPEVASK